MIKFMYRNIKNLVIFQTIFSLVVYSIITPLVKWLFKISILASGVNNLTQEYFALYLRNPISMAIAFVILFIIAIVTLFYFNALIIFYIASKQDRKIGVYSFILTTYKNSKGILQVRNLKLFLYIAFVLPSVSLIFTNPIIKKISIPPFIMDWFIDNSLLFIPFVIFNIWLLIYAWNGLFLFYYMYTRKLKYKEAMSCSKFLVESNKKAIIKSFIKILLFALIITIIKRILQQLFFYICTIFSIGIMFKIFTTVFSLIKLLMMVLFQIVTNVYGIYQLGKIFYTYEELPIIEYEEDKLYKIPLIVQIPIAIVGFLILTSSGVFFVYQDSLPSISIIAHRGASEKELENTKEAFLLAQNEGANMIELDVRLTKDDQLVIYHDESLQRLAELNKDIKDLTYEEIQEITIRDEELDKSGKIMLLKDLLPLINSDVKLLIEIKQSDNDGIKIANLLEPLLTPFYSRFMIGSLDIEVLEQVKKNNPFRETVYFLAMTFGDWYNYDSVDYYNIEQSFVTKNTVEKIHKQNKKIFVWTINDDDDFYMFQNLRVDGILTDYPKEMVSLNNSSQLEYNKNNLFQFFEIINKFRSI